MHWLQDQQVTQHILGLKDQEEATEEQSRNQ